MMSVMITFILSNLLCKGGSGDLLVVLSGSGNSPNILRVLEQAKTMGVKSCAILGYTGWQL